MPENLTELVLALVIAGVCIAVPVLLALLILDLSKRLSGRTRK